MATDDTKPGPKAQEVLDTLRSIDSHLAALVRHFGAGIQGQSHAPSGMPDVPAIASAADLDSKYGDPEVKAKSPRDWTGETQQGKRFSQCPAEYLDMVADRLDYFAGREEDPKKARYNRIDASRARGWAQRKRAGWTAPVDAGGFPSDNGAQVAEDDIAFSIMLLIAAIPMALRMFA